MVCTNCGEEGHNIKTCPRIQEMDADLSTKRGLRESPRTPAQEEKVAKLWNISQKLSPTTKVPPLQVLAALRAWTGPPPLEEQNKINNPSMRMAL